MKLLQVALASAVFALFASQAGAQVTFQTPMQFAGTGCKPGSYAFSGQGSDTLSVLFSAYDAAKPNSKAASKMENAACGFIVPVQVPKGIQVSTMTADWRGFAEGNTQFFREYFFAGQAGPKVTSNPKGNYTLRDNLMHSTWSGCNGGTVQMRINSRVRAIGQPSYIGLDSIDMKNKVIFHLVSRKCR